VTVTDRAAERARAPLRKHGKVTLQQAIRLAFNFAQGIPLDDTARAVGLTRKSVRDEFVQLRELLVRPQFNRWHQTNRALVMIADPEQEALVRATFFDVIGECFLNDTCYRNFRLGNRKARLCRACPVPGKFREERDIAAAVAAVDAVRVFYEQLGWRGERDEDPYRIFRRRFIHTNVVSTALSNSRKFGNGIADPADTGFLSVRSLAEKLIDEAVRHD